MAGLTDNEIWDACNEEMLKRKEFDFYQLFNGGDSSYEELSSDEVKELSDQLLRWGDYRYEHCRLTLEPDGAIE